MRIQTDLPIFSFKKRRPKPKKTVVDRIKNRGNAFLYSFPVQLLINHFKNNQALLLIWLILFAIITENFGNVFGIPYLFLDPEYISKVNFWSFFIVGVSVGGFIMAFHIACYIMDGHKFTFLGLLSRPFTKFSINNAPIPTLFLIVYVFSIIRFQLNNEDFNVGIILIKTCGLLSGCLAMFILLYSYFRFTNKDIFRFAALKVENRLKKAALTRLRILTRYRKGKKEDLRIDNYLDVSLSAQKTPEQPIYFNKEHVLKVFDQNHLNSVIIETLALVSLLLLGIFRELPAFQIPAAASGILLFTIFIMLAGAVSYWFKSWAITTVIAFVLLLNFLVENELILKVYKAYGLDYKEQPADYSLSNIRQLNSISNYSKDKENTLKILENWKAKFPPDRKPKMVFICASGGGLRAALWTFGNLQAADSLTDGQLMRQTMLMTGASGGLLGSSYFRELYLQKQSGNPVNIYSRSHSENIAGDILNPLIFSLVVNDIFIRYQDFEYNGLSYPKDRGYAFEEQINKNTHGVLNKKLSDYRVPEFNSEIPMMIMAPTIVNDGRKLFISPHNVSYLHLADTFDRGYSDSKLKGMDFNYLFNRHSAEDLRFLTALRMSATFPYITPNITLPTSPAIEIMDAGLSDNFGISDAIGFLSVFKEWIHENTSGVILLSIRDTEKNTKIEKKPAPSLFEKIITPVRSLYNNWANIQDINNANQVELAKLWFKGQIYQIDLEYSTQQLLTQQPLGPKPSSNEIKEQKEIARASLSWHLTTLEKKSIMDNIHHPRNEEALDRLRELLETE